MAVLGFSVYIYLEPEAQDIILASGQQHAVQIMLYALMGIGGITLVIALFGCCGAYHESQCLLGTYFTILIVIFATQVTGATLGYLYREEVRVTFIQNIFYLLIIFHLSVILSITSIKRNL